jgi:hypothetical protein
MPADADRLGDHGQRGISDLDDIVDACAVLDQHNELVAPMRATRWAEIRSPSRPERDQQLIADVMAERVVDRLEPVRSMKHSPTRRPSTHASVNTPASRSAKSARFGRPVSGSWVAW